MRNRILAVFCGLTLTAGAANAAEYGTAGCGLGAVLLGDEPGAIQILAATLNGIFGNQTFGMSTGTLNCGTAGFKGVAANTKIYVEANREVIARDIARGQGDTIVGLSAIAGCRDTQKVGAVLQSKFDVIFPTEKVESDAVTHAVLDTLRAEPSLACQQLAI